MVYVVKGSKQHVSILDVARVAEVSPATASRVLSGSAYPVRASTRERVVAAASTLDFRPNLLARALVTAKTSTLGAIVHDIADPYFGEIVRGLEDAARLSGYQLFVCSSDRDADRELEYVRGLLSRRVDGLIFAGGGIEQRVYAVKLREMLDRFRDHGGSVVVLSPHGYKAPTVLPDNRNGARQMAEYLLSLGHRHMGVISGPIHLRTSTVRLRAWEEALERGGARQDPSLTEPGGFTIDGGAVAAATLLDRQPGITAIFALNDLMAIGALAEIRRRNLRIPAQISVAGFDDIEIAKHANPPLTTIHLSLYELGKHGAQMSLALLRGTEVESVVLPADLVVRQSTGPAPTGAGADA